MSRYRYSKLRVSCLEPRDYPIGDVRSAVEYLKTVPGELAGLVAIAETVDAGTYKYAPKPMLYLKEIRGRTPAELWEKFDHLIDEHVSYLVDRGRSGMNP